MSKFHAPKTKAGLARAGPYTVASSAASIPRAGDLLNAVSPVKSRKLPVQADVHADVRLFGENASLFNVALQHEAKPSVLFDVLASFKLFLAQRPTEEEAPQDLRELAAKWYMRIALPPREDPGSIGFNRGRISIFVAGDSSYLSNMLHLLLDFIAFKVASEGMTMRAVHFHAEAAAGLADKQAAFADQAVLHGPDEQQPFYLSPPISGARHTNLILDFTDERLELIFFGAIWAFRKLFTNAGIQGSYAGEGSSEYFRVHALDYGHVTFEAENILHLLQNVLAGTMCRVVLRTPPTAAAGQQIVSQLKTCRFLAFASP